ncbi:MAG: ABC transporter substrate-binding protein [Bacteroidales bacterium]|nr:ABC transporter substrate-binding protein [Bacteroidales bacterium]
MENKYFSIKNSLIDITEKYPETISVFTSSGFTQLADEAKRKVFGKIGLEMALNLKQININTFCENLIETIEQNRNQVDASLNMYEEKVGPNAIRVSGLLPCPVRMPLEEGLSSFKEKYNQENKTPLKFNLKAASMGLDWLKEELGEVTDEDNLDEVFISAGFDMFFDEKLFGKFVSKGAFKDITGLEKYNSIFDNDQINLRDPKGQYSMLGVVPAVFLINTKELGDREMPRTWTDILKPEFENSISLPVADFDLFNAILLHLNQKYGESAVRKLGKSLLQSMHPSQMVKSHQKSQAKPAVTIMPYFFTRMAKEGGVMQAVWPEDGAIISPIFMLTKAKYEKELKPVVDFFMSYDVAEILAIKGLFPSVSPNIDNQIPEQNKFMWLGWDYIYQNKVSDMIPRLEAIFHEGGL